MKGKFVSSKNCRIKPKYAGELHGIVQGRARRTSMKYPRPHRSTESWEQNQARATRRRHSPLGRPSASRSSDSHTCAGTTELPETGTRQSKPSKLFLSDAWMRYCPATFKAWLNSQLHHSSIQQNRVPARPSPSALWQSTIHQQTSSRE